MIEYLVRREGSEHTIAVSSIDPDGADVSLELATDVAKVLSKAWACVLTLERLDDMAWHERDYVVPVAAYDNGEKVTQ